MGKDSLYQKSYINTLSQLKEFTPETYQAFISFYHVSLEQKVLSKKIKELIAVAIAHVTGCAYSIEQHVLNLKKLNVSKEEITEAIMVATMLKAGSSIAHGINTLNAYDEKEDEELYKRSYMSRYKELKVIIPDVFQSYSKFNAKTMEENLLTRKEKELIAIAVAHVTGCAYCIESHTKKAKRIGLTLEEIAEAIFIAVALKADSAFSHSVNMLNAFLEV